MKKILPMLLAILIFSLSLVAFSATVSAEYASFLPTATLVKAESVSSTSIRIEWEHEYSYRVNGYQIYRATSKNGTYSLVETTDSYWNNYTDTNLTPGKTYYYKVRTCTGVYYGKFSNVKSAVATPAKMYFTATQEEKNAITLSWNKTDQEVDGYVIYRSSSKNGTYKAIKRIKNADTTSYRDKTASNGKTYYYKMKPFIKVKGKSILGPESDPERSLMHVKLCQAYIVKMENLPTDPYDFESVIRVKRGNTILTENKDYYGYISGCGRSNGKLDHVYYTVYGYEAGGLTGSYEFCVSLISAKASLYQVSITNSGARVSWREESGAYGYQIYRKIGSKSFSLVKTITDNSVTYWVDKTATKLNTQYTYCVRAYTKNGSKNLYTKKSNALSVERIGTPKMKSVANQKTGILVKWGKVKNAWKYTVLRKSGKGDWQTLTTTTETQYLDTTTKVGTTYTYAVCCSDWDGKIISYHSPKGLKIKRRVTAVGTSLSKTSVKITWNKTSSATGYAIYRSTSKNGTYKKIATTKKGTYTDKKLTFAKYYYYKIRPYTIKNGKTVYGDYGLVLKIRPTLGTVSVKKAKATSHSKVKVTWNKLPNASGYQVYVATSKDGKYKKMKTVSGNSTTSCTVTNLENGITYYFKVRGYIKSKGKTYCGGLSSAKSHLIDVLGYASEDYYSKNMRIWGTEEYGGYNSAKEAKKNMVTIKIKTWDINSKGKKYTRYHTLTVHKNIAPTVKQIFKEIYNGKEKFPIKDVSCYSWRGNGAYSQHGAGLAIDINPNENAQFDGDTGKVKVGSFWKPGKNPYSIKPDGDVVRIFEKYGFGWGSWFWDPDYMHFSYYGT